MTGRRPGMFLGPRCEVSTLGGAAGSTPTATGTERNSREQQWLKYVSQAYQDVSEKGSLSLSFSALGIWEGVSWM